MVTIRPETPDDIPDVAAVHVRAWQSGYAGIIPQEVLDALDPEQRAAQRRQHHGAEAFQTLVATDHNAVLGFVSFGPYRNQQDRTDLDPTVGEVLAIYLEPDRVGTGIGRELMRAALTELTRRGYKEVRLWVLEDNHRTRRFYAKAGFTPDGERATYDVVVPSSGDRVPLPELRYSRVLD
ncbi:N-acetyltransferase [Asanoa ishikariensis]|uniref:L-amino acid N-acyltransferase YncA n=1 Tax=Asanoa ishikariensis TaxID=137265 RepID=A0A1H3RP97_9ACTN|nr:GNAT family N-acetyltransferase [Asanoa ishikariensis]GIF67032.1 N-acetyltransferase [Asanoa ishikariensis]SDZ27061.1 L-amino acid N-acyltransferase YncA [Asanoa ishikariensis]